MDIEGIKAAIEENPNDARALNNALKEILAAPGEGDAMGAFDELLDLLFDGGDRDAMLRTLDARMRTLKGATDEEAILLAEVATRYWRGMGAPDRAEPFFRKLKALPGYQDAVREFYTDFYLDRGNWRRLEELMFESAGITSDDPGASTIYKRLADLTAARGDAAREAQYLDKVHKADPGDEEVVDRLITVNKSSGRWHVVAKLLEARAGRLGGDDDEALLRLRDTYAELVRVYSEEMGVEAKALSVYDAWRKQDPTNRGVSERLLDLYGRLGRWPHYVKLLAEVADAEDDPTHRKTRLVELAETYLERMRNIPEAIKALEQALALDPESTELVGRLKELYKERRDFDSYVALSLDEIAGIEDADERLAARVALAQLGQRELRKPDAVIPLWEQVLADDPAHDEARDALADLYERTHAYDQLIALLEERAATEADSAACARLHERIAITAHTRLKDPARAVAAWEQLLELEPEHPRAFAEVRKHDLENNRWEHLEALFRRRGSLDELARVIESQVRKADGADAQAALLEILVRIYADDLNDEARALRPLEQLHRLRPEDPEVLRRLADLARSADDARRLDDALSALAPLLDDAAERKVIWLELADLAEQRLMKPAQAFFHCVAAYKEDPTDLGLVDRLGGLADRSGEEEVLLDVLEESFPAIAPDVAVAVPIALHIARRAVASGDEDSRAIRFYGEILGRDPEHVEALEALLTDARRRSDADAQIIYLRRLAQVVTDGRRVDLLAEAAELQAGEGDTNGAEDTLSQAIAEAPTRVDLHVRLERLYAVGGRYGDAAAAVGSMVEALGGQLQPAALAGAHVRLGTARLLDGEPVEEAADHLLEALRVDPAHPDATQLLIEHVGALRERGDVLEAIAGALRAMDDQQGLADIIEIQARRAEGPEQVDRLRALLQLYRGPLADAHLEFRTLGRLYRHDPGDAALRESLEDSAGRADLWFHLVGLYGDLAEESGGSLRRTLRLRVAEIQLDRLDDAEAAAQTMEAIAAESPDDREVLERLVALYDREGRHADLVAAIRRLVPLVGDEDALALRLRLAELLRHALDDPAGAREVLGDARALWPDRPEVLLGLRDLHEQLDEPEETEDVLRALAGLASDPEERHAYRIAAGRLSWSRLEQPAEALARVRAVLAEAPVHAGAIELATRVFEGSDDHRGEAAELLAPALRASEDANAAQALVPVLEALEAGAGDPRAKADLHIELADLYLGPLGEAELGEMHLRMACEQVPGDAGLRGRLRSLAVDHGTLAEHVRFLEAQVDGADDLAVQVALLQESAAVLSEDLDDVDGALERHARVVRDLDLENRASLDTLLDTLEGTGQFAVFLDWVDHALEVRHDPTERRALFLRAISAARAVPDVDRALADLDRAEAELPDDLPIRRIHVEVAREADRSEALASALDGVVRFGDDPAEKAAARRERAFLLAGTEGAEEDAILEVQVYLDDHPEDRAALELLCDLHSRVEAHDELVRDLQRLRDLVPSEEAEVRSALALRIARGHAGPLDRPDAAVEWYGTILEGDPSHAEVIADLEDLLARDLCADQAFALLDRAYESSGSAEDRVRVREVRAARVDAPKVRAELLREAADMARDELGDTERALRDLLEVMSLEPGLRGIRARCAEYAAESQQQGLLAERLGAVAENVGDPMLQAEILRERAGVQRDALGDLDGAVASLQAALVSFPLDRAAQDTLDALFVEHGRHGELAELLELRATHAKDEAERHAFQLRRADVLAGPLGEPSEAVMVMLGLLPAGGEAPSADVVDRMQGLFDQGISGEDLFGVLDGIYRRAEDDHALARLLATRAQQVEPGPDRVMVLRRLGEIQASRLEDPTAAIEPYAEAWRLDPSDPSLKDALQAVCASADALDRYAASLADVAAANDDDEVKADLMLEEAALRRDRLDDIDGAEAVYRRVLELAPERLAAWKALDDMLTRGDRHEELARVLRSEASLQDGPERAATLHRLSDLQGDVLSDAEGARATLEEIIDVSPADTAAHRKLAEILDRLEDGEALAAALRAWSEAVSDPEERANLLAGSAQLHHRRGEFAEAAAAYDEALMLAPGRLEIARSLQDIAREAEDWERLAELLQHELRGLAADDGPDATERRSAVHVELAEVQATRLDDAYGALRELDAAVRIEPQRRALWLQMRDLARQVGQADAEIKAIDALLGLEDTADDERTDLLRSLAVLRTEVLPDPAAAIKAWGAYLERRVQDRSAHEAYLDLLEREQRNEALVAHLGLVASTPEAGFKDEERTDLRLRQAELTLSRLDNAADAATILEALVSEQPACLPALEMLEQIYRTIDRPTELAQVLVRRVDTLEEPGDAVALLRDVADIYAGRLGDHESALYALLDAMRRDPEDGSLVGAALAEADALGRYEEFLAIGADALGGLDEELREERALRLAEVAAGKAGSASRAVELVEGTLAEIGPRTALLERQIELLEALDEPERQVAALQALFDHLDDAFLKVPVARRQAALLEDKLSDHGGAIRCYEAICSLDSAHVEALTALERLYAHVDDPARLVTTCERLLDVQPARAGELLKRMGRLQLERLGEPAKAAEAFEQAVAADPRDREVYELLEMTYGASEDWDGLADVYDRWTSAETTPEGKALVCRKLAILREEAQGDRDGAADAYFQALLADPDDAEALAGLERIHREAGRPEELVYLYADLAQRTGDPKRRVAMLRRSVPIYIDDMDDPDNAVRVLEGILDVAPDDMESLNLWLRHSESLDRPEHQVEFLRGHLSRVPAGPARRRSALALARIQHERLGDADGAVGVLDGHLEPADETREALELYADLYESLGQLDALEKILAKRQATAEGSTDLAEVQYRIGRLAEKREQVDEAMRCYEQALQSFPTHQGVLRSLAGLFLQRDMAVEAEPLLRLLVDELRKADAPAAALGDAYELLGDTHVRLLDHDGALLHYREALQLQPDDPRLQVLVGELAWKAGNPEVAREQLERVLVSGHSLALEPLKKAHQTLAAIAMSEGSTDEARRHLLEVVALDPSNEKVVEEMVELSIQFGDFEGALDHLRALGDLRRNPVERYELLLRMAEIARDRIGDMGRAESILNEAVGVHPGGRAARIELLRVFSAEERFSDALRALLGLAELEADPARRIEYLISAAQIARDRLGDQAKAIELLNEVLDADPSRVQAFALIDQILTENRDWEAQELNYRRMLDRLRDQEGMEEIRFRLYSGLGEIYRSRIGDMKVAADAFEIARQLQPDHLPTLEILADLYGRMGDAGRGTRVLRDLARGRPGDADAMKALFDSALTSRNDELARVAAQVLVLLRKADGEVKGWHDERVRPMMVQARKRLGMSAWQKVIIPRTETAAVGEFFAILYRVLAAVLETRDLRSVGVKRRDEIDLNGKEMIANVLRRTMTVLGISLEGQLKLYRHGSGMGLRLEPTRPISVLCGADMLKGRSEAELGFMMGKHLALLLPQHALASLYGPARLEALALAAELHFNPDHPVPAGMEGIADAAEAISESITPADEDRLRRLMPVISQRGETKILRHFLDHVEVAAVRAGLLVADDLGVAAQAIGGGEGIVLGSQSGSQQIKGLIRWMLSDDYLEARQTIGVA